MVGVPPRPVRIGVLAVQGGFAAHVAHLSSVGARAVEVRLPEEAEGLDGLILPGGESTTIMMGIEAAGLEPAIRAHHEAGRPILGTCAGMIISDRDHLGLIDITTKRNVVDQTSDLDGRGAERRAGSHNAGAHTKNDRVRAQFVASQAQRRCWSDGF